VPSGPSGHVYPEGRGGPSDGAQSPSPLASRPGPGRTGPSPLPPAGLPAAPGAPASTGSGLKATGTAGVCRPLHDEKTVST
jgi:hypothetical protein